MCALGIVKTVGHVLARTAIIPEVHSSVSSTAREQFNVIVHPMGIGESDVRYRLEGKIGFAV